MRTKILIPALILIQTSLFSQITAKEKKESDYVVLINNDTLYGKMGMISTGSFGLKGKFTPKEGEKFSVNIKEEKALRIDGIDYEVNLREPQYGAKGNRDFVKIMLKNGAYKLYEVFQGTNGVYDYFLFEGEKYIDKVSKKNYEEVIAKYFASSKSIESAMKLGYVKFKDMDQLSLHYYEDLRK
jgi:hypothetical protein